jgi:hypothetical protein
VLPDGSGIVHAPPAGGDSGREVVDVSRKLEITFNWIDELLLLAPAAK